MFATLFSRCVYVCVCVLLYIYAYWMRKVRIELSTESTLRAGFCVWTLAVAVAHLAAAATAVVAVVVDCFSERFRNLAYKFFIFLLQYFSSSSSFILVLPLNTSLFFWNSFLVFVCWYVNVANCLFRLWWLGGSARSYIRQTNASLSLVRSFYTKSPHR